MRWLLTKKRFRLHDLENQPKLRFSLTKTKFQIINKNYQPAPDKIVGKMTIEKLDKDMAD